jgi:hypothetical protein
MLSDAKVEVLDGPEAGTSATTNTSGSFSLSGTFDDSTRFRATKDGYVTATATLPICSPCTPNRRPLSFDLAVLATPVDLAGDYTLTFHAESSCLDIPSDLRTRTYAATITPASYSYAPPNTTFDVTLSGAPVLEAFSRFLIGVAGDDVTFWVDDPPLVEQIGANSFLEVHGLASASITSPAAGISASLDGSFDYCERKSPIGRYYDCTGDQVVAHHQCSAKNNRMILTRR